MAKVAAQVLLQVTPVARTAVTTDYTATVTVKAPANSAVTGTYTLVEAGAVIASGSLVGGSARVQLDLAPGTHKITAVYSGAAKVNGASTKEVVVAVPAV
ncbi:Ig-like domain-containing protein [Cellulomonas endometrii]|uniref:Ig-like domain-containing protein n=1 Tax=Cellulomonas endometrii TaxID=3036301 RepID=UPI0024ADA2CF|nr:Ig-like domain-containing protein [Cellulomonas endometrii]